MGGAHVWFFFSAPIAASTARKMGCHLITETMARRHADAEDRWVAQSAAALPSLSSPVREGGGVAEASVFFVLGFVPSR